MDAPSDYNAWEDPYDADEEDLIESYIAYWILMAGGA